MDRLPDLEVLVPSLSVLGLLGWLIVSLMVQHRADRGDHRAARTELREQIKELREQIKALRTELATAYRDLETQRRLRHEAEDETALLRRQSVMRNGGRAFPGDDLDVRD